MIYRILTVVTPLITSPYLARALGVEALGKYSASQAFVNYFVLLAMLGIENYGNRTIAKVQDDKDARSKAFWNIYTIQFGAACGSVMVYIALVNFLIAPELKLIYMLQGLWLIDSLLNINWFFWGCEQFKLTVTRNIIIKILSVISILLFVKRPEDLWIYVVIMGLSMVLAKGVLWVFLPKYVTHYKVKPIEVYDNIKPILQLFLPVLALNVFHNMDKTMLNMLSDDANSGYYYNADKLINIPLQLITGMSAVMLPRIANILQTEGNKKAMGLLTKSAELALFLTCSIAFGIGAVSDSFVPFFFGKGYEPCIMLIKVFVPVLIIKALSDFIRTQYLIPAGKDRIYTSAALGGAVSNIIVNYIMILRFGALGAVIGTLVAELTVLLIQIWGIRNEFSLRAIVGKNFIYIVFGMVMFTIVTILSKHSSGSGGIKVVLLITVGAAVYMFLCIYYWTVNRNSIFSKYIPWRKHNG